MKALVMFSWWLDSILAVKILEKQWIDCTAIIFTSPFFSDKKAKIQAEKFDIKLMSVDITDPHFQMLQSPVYWYGKNLNPCIDCHGLMFKIAWEIADQEWFQIIASWEVVGQRPMSQNKSALNSVSKITWRDILRPLSAKLLPETIYEKQGLVDRNQLLDISGRARKTQLQLAEEFGLQWYESPWGGCLLTETWYTNKLKSLFQSFPKEILPIDAELLKYTRLQIFPRWFVMMWKDNETNLKILEIIQKEKKHSNRYLVLKLKNITWPIGLVRNIFWEQNYLHDCKTLFKEKVGKLKNMEDFDFEN
jgi:tRNA U34 2-thiouridine synthase MnmA/TrmU